MADGNREPGDLKRKQEGWGGRWEQRRLCWPSLLEPWGNASWEYLNHLGMGSRVENWPLEKMPPLLQVPHLLELTQKFRPGRDDEQSLEVGVGMPYRGSQYHRAGESVAETAGCPSITGVGTVDTAKSLRRGVRADLGQSGKMWPEAVLVPCLC